MAKLAFIYFAATTKGSPYTKTRTITKQLADELAKAGYIKISETAVAVAPGPNDNAQTIEARFDFLPIPPLVLIMRFAGNPAASFSTDIDLQDTHAYWDDVVPKLRKIAGV